MLLMLIMNIFLNSPFNFWRYSLQLLSSGLQGSTVTMVSPGMRRHLSHNEAGSVFFNIQIKSALHARAHMQTRTHTHTHVCAHAHRHRWKDLQSRATLQTPCHVRPLWQ